MRTTKLLRSWLVGLFVQLATTTILLVAAVSIAHAAGSGSGDGAGDSWFSGAIVSALGVLALTPVIAGAASAAAACSMYPWHTGMSWWKWTVVGTGAPAVAAAVVEAGLRGGLGAPLLIDGQRVVTPAFAVLLVVLAVAAPVVTAVTLGRMRNRRAATLRDAVQSASRVATMQIPVVTRAGRDSVAVAAISVIGIALVAASVMATVTTA